MKHFIKKLLKPRHLEYLELNESLQIIEMSTGVKCLADAPEKVQKGHDIRLGFPELVGFEEIIRDVLEEKQENFELKGIDRSDNHDDPLYIDLYAIAYPDDDNQEQNRLILLVENVTERMSMAQKLVQQNNETTLLYNSLKQAKAYIDQIISSMADALLVTDENGYIKKINKTTQDLFGYQEHELVGEAIYLIIQSQNICHNLQVFNKLNQQIFQDQEFICYNKEGKELTLSFSCSWIKKNTYDAPEFIYIGRDITTRKQAEKALEYAKKEAEAASQIKSQFLANMSHEIRTPMNAIVGISELLLTTSLTAEQKDFIKTISNSSEYLLKLINEILDISKLEAGHMKLDILNFNMSICLDKVIDILAPTAHKKYLEITLLISDDIPTNLRGDPNRLQQILTNLISNAIKFTENGEVCIQIEIEQETETKVTLYFSVRDTGIGIMQSDIYKLFQPFCQLDGSNTRKYEGTGLGLAICKQLVTMMGGEIGVNSQLGKGSNFWMKIPFDKLTYPQVPVKIISPLKERHILLLDDHANHRQMIREQVIDWEMQITEADSAMLAGNGLENFSNTKGHKGYDLALIAMPISGVNGVAFGQTIKQNTLLASIPLILIRSLQQGKIAKQLLELGFAADLVKPVKPCRLFESIIRVLECHSATITKLSELKNLNKLSIQNSQQIQPQRLKILIAEDNIVNQKVALRLLKNIGYDADVVANGQEVIERLQQIPYDVVFMDCQMPVLDGYKATQEIRRKWGGDRLSGNNAIRRPVVIALTANAMKQDKQKCFAVGMDDFISKPVRLEQLRAILSNWTQKLLD